MGRWGSVEVKCVLILQRGGNRCDQTVQVTLRLSDNLCGWLSLIYEMAQEQLMSCHSLAEAVILQDKYSEFYLNIVADAG
jgi:hypothetical protein